MERQPEIMWRKPYIVFILMTEWSVIIIASKIAAFVYVYWLIVSYDIRVCNYLHDNFQHKLAIQTKAWTYL